MRALDFSEGFPGQLVPTERGALAFLPDGLPPQLRIDEEIQRANDRAVLALGALQATILGLPNPALATSPLMRREAVLSSKIEGTHTGIAELFRYEAEGGLDQSDPEKRDAREVMNYVRALSLGLDSLKTLPVCCRVMKDMHAALMNHVRGSDKRPGEFRLIQNYIGDRSLIEAAADARFIPPPPDAVAPLMADLERYINEPNDALPALVRVAVVHYQFETVHPFLDGNGRLGRLLVSLMLAADRFLDGPYLYVSGHLERHRRRYVDLMLSVSRTGAWKPWIAFFLEAVRHEAVDTAARVRRLLALRERMRSEIQRHTRASASVLELVDSLFVRPVLTIPEAAERLNGMSYQGAKKHVDRLVDRGFLQVIEEPYGRARRYLSQPVVDIVSIDDATVET